MQQQNEKEFSPQAKGPINLAFICLKGILSRGRSVFVLLTPRRKDPCPMLTPQRKRAPLHPLTPNNNKIVAAISYVIKLANDRAREITQYDIIKTLFLADRAHLNKYGRPITFDNYVAMKDGPVASLSYNLLKDETDVIARHHIEIPWTKHPAPNISPKAFSYHIDPSRVSSQCLSESDIEELSSALTVVKSLGFSQIRQLTHNDAAYIEAWQDDGASRSYNMSLSMLFDVPNERAAETLSFLSKHS